MDLTTKSLAPISRVTFYDKDLLVVSLFDKIVLAVADIPSNVADKILLFDLSCLILLIHEVRFAAMLLLILGVRKPFYLLQ